MKNREFWSKVVVRGADGEIDYNATKAELKQFCELIKLDQERVKECVDAILKDCALHSHVLKPNIQGAVCNRLAPADMSVWNDLRERTAEVLARHYKIERKSGVINPYYEAPAPDSRQAAANGNAR